MPPAARLPLIVLGKFLPVLSSKKISYQNLPCLRCRSKQTVKLGLCTPPVSTEIEKIRIEYVISS
jgi:hypothetical protein